MAYFKAKMHQIRFQPRLHPRLHWGSLQRSPGLLAGFKGPTYKEMKGKEGEKGREIREREGREGRGGKKEKGRERFASWLLGGWTPLQKRHTHSLAMICTIYWQALSTRVGRPIIMQSGVLNNGSMTYLLCFCMHATNEILPILQ